MAFRDLRYALRSLRRSPGFVVVAILALGLGLGLSTTMFGVLDAVLNPRSGYANFDRLFNVGVRSGPQATLSRGELLQLIRDQSHSFGALVPWRYDRVPVGIGDDVDNLGVLSVPPAWFAITGAEIRFGRGFVAADGDGVAVLSSGLWDQLFGGRRWGAGAHVMIAGHSRSVVGVLSRDASRSTFGAALVPIASGSSASTSGSFLSWMALLGRLRTGVSPPQARLEMQALGDALTVRTGASDYPYAFLIGPLQQRQEELRDIHKAMVGAALAVLLIACVNLAHLMLARGLAKRRELAIRMALGAGRPAAVRVMFAESALITLGGVALGAVLAVWGVHVLANTMPSDVAWVGLIHPQLSWRVFALAAVAAAASAVVFGLVPAIRVAFGVELTDPLKDGAGTTGRNRGRYSPLVMAEVGLGLVLLMGAALLLRTVDQVRAQSYDFDAEKLLRVYVNMRGKDSATVAGWVRVLAAANGVKGVVGAALEGSAAAPGAAVTGELTEDTTRLITMPAYSLVSAGYLRTHGLPVLHGRDFEPGDAAGDGVAILSTTAAARLYPRESAVGHMVKLGGPASKAPWVRIVGVARTPVLLSIEAELAPVLVWVCRRLEGWPTAFVLVRTGARDPKVALRVRQAVRGVPDVRAAYVSSFTDERDRELASRSFLAKVFVGMGVVGLALAALGLYGVLAYAVTERTREFAVRVALGAEGRTIFRIVLHDGLVMLLAGTGVGAFGALASAYLLNAVLVAVYPTDVISLIIAEAVLIGVGLAAALVPARRAMRADPIEILRAN